MNNTFSTIVFAAVAVVGCQNTPTEAEHTVAPAASEVTVQASAAAPAATAPVLPTNVEVPGVGSCQPSSEINTLATRAVDLADVNGDGRISHDEAQSMVNLVLGGAFFRADENGDGKITAEEGKAARAALLSEHPALAALLARGRDATGTTPFKSLAQLVDPNYGQTLTLVDARNAANTAVNDFYRMTDSNKDGFISRDEAISAGTQGAAALGSEAFSAADSNHDHALSPAEFTNVLTSSANSIFQTFDTNKDGKLTEAEAAAAINAAGIRVGMPMAPAKG
ncbi:MAG: hypothetical protein ABIQ16_11215 [Polyangiaceae bacterium]